DGFPCEDGDPCTAGDVCLASSCHPGIGGGLHLGTPTLVVHDDVEPGAPPPTDPEPPDAGAGMMRRDPNMAAPLFGQWPASLDGLVDVPTFNASSLNNPTLLLMWRGSSVNQGPG